MNYDGIRWFQVVFMDRKGYILDHSDFLPSERERMLSIINKRLMENETNKIEIVRWGVNGERV